MSNYTTSIPWSQTAAGKRCLAGLEERKNQAKIQKNTLTQEDLDRSKISINFLDQDRDHDRSSVSPRSKTSRINTLAENNPVLGPILSDDPDGLNSQIRGKYAELLKTDESMLLARSWGCHPAVLTAAFKRMGEEWVRKEIEFVAGNAKVLSKGPYLAKILARNPY